MTSIRGRAPVVLLALGLAGIAGTSAASTAPDPTSTGVRAETGSSSGIEQIDHVIIIVQENRSFDHYFGTYPGADGIPTRANGHTRVCIPNPFGRRCAKPYHSDSLFQEGGPHARPASTADINEGRMNGFIRVLGSKQSYCHVTPSLPGCAGRLGPQSQADVMSWHDDREIPNYWAYAEHFVLQDRMFGPTDSWTLPAHLFLVSAWSASCSDPPDPMSCTSDVSLRGPKDLVRYGQRPRYAWTDITYLLHEAGVSWAYYIHRGTCLDKPCDHPVDGGTTPAKNPLIGFVTVHQNEQLGNIRTHPDYFAAARSGAPPSVSWIVPGDCCSEHPASDTPSVMDRPT